MVFGMTLATYTLAHVVISLNPADLPATHNGCARCGAPTPGSPTDQ